METTTVKMYTEWGQPPALVRHRVVSMSEHDMPGFVVLECRPPVGSATLTIVDLSEIKWFDVITDEVRRWD